MSTIVYGRHYVRWEGTWSSEGDQPMTREDALSDERAETGPCAGAAVAGTRGPDSCGRSRWRDWPPTTNGRVGGAGAAVFLLRCAPGLDAKDVSLWCGVPRGRLVVGSGSEGGGFVSNTIHLIGNVASVITRNDYTRPDGEVLTKIRFLLATDKDLKPRPDGKPWPADYIPGEVWGAAGRAVAEYKGKGSKLAIRGRLKGEFYRPEGAEKDVLQVAVVADRVDFLGPKRA